MTAVRDHIARTPVCTLAMKLDAASIPLALALCAAGCTRLSPAHTQSSESVITADRARAPSEDNASVRALFALDGGAREGLPPLFARKVACLAQTRAGAFTRSRAVDGGREYDRLTMDELRATPWLWGQYPSSCVGLAMPGGEAAIAELAEGAMRTRIERAIERYLSFGRVDDIQRWAPFDCRLPPASRPQSDAAESAPHGRKVYYLYALDRRAYLAHDDVEAQVIVKESWTPREIPVEQAVSSGYPAQCVPTSAGRCVQPDRFIGLFLMLRGPVTAQTDAGWTYATVDPNGTVTASGRVAACMRCHERAPHGRLFGLAHPEHAQWR